MASEGGRGRQELFDREWRSLTAEQQRAFREAVAAFVEDLPVAAGEAHIVWRRIGTHKIFTRP